MTATKNFFVLPCEGTFQKLLSILICISINEKYYVLYICWSRPYRKAVGGINTYKVSQTLLWPIWSISVSEWHWSVKVGAPIVSLSVIMLPTRYSISSKGPSSPLLPGYMCWEPQAAPLRPTQGRHPPCRHSGRDPKENLISTWKYDPHLSP